MVKLGCRLRYPYASLRDQVKEKTSGQVALTNTRYMFASLTPEVSVLEPRVRRLSCTTMTVQPERGTRSDRQRCKSYSHFRPGSCPRLRATQGLVFSNTSGKLLRLASQSNRFNIVTICKTITYDLIKPNAATLPPASPTNRELSDAFSNFGQLCLHINQR